MRQAFVQETQNKYKKPASLNWSDETKRILNQLNRQLQKEAVAR